MDPRAHLDGCGKFRFTPGFDPRTVEPVVIHYTYLAIPDQAQKSKEMLILLYTMISFLHSFAFDEPSNKQHIEMKFLVLSPPVLISLQVASVLQFSGSICPAVYR